ncbi:MAG: hypothetical protein JSR89_12485 [Proteobacteria bacterium]|nr:hypothetical protein [Pseudomonadota bacterium]
MFEIYELTAAPHFPQPLKGQACADRPENIVALLAQAADGDQGIEITMRGGEIFIALKSS